MIFKQELMNNLIHLMAILITVDKINISEFRQSLIMAFQEEKNKDKVHDHYCLIIDVLNIVEVLKHQTVPRYQTIIDDFLRSDCFYQDEKAIVIPVISNN